MIISDVQFGNRLRGLRNLANLSQEELAKAAFPDKDANAARQRLGRIERGITYPNSREVVALLGAVASQLPLSHDEIRSFLMAQPVLERSLGRKEISDSISDLEITLQEQLDSKTDGLSEEQLASVNNARQVLRVLRKIAGLLPEQNFWDAFIRCAQIQQVGSHLRRMYGSLQRDEVLPRARVRTMDTTIGFLEALQGTRSVPRLIEGQPVMKVMCAWVDALEKGDTLFAVSYSSPEDSWRSAQWKPYRKANLDAARRGAKITRVRIYDSFKELDCLEDILTEQKEAGIKVLVIDAKKLNNIFFDFGLFFNLIVGVLSWNRATRSPEAIEILPLNEQWEYHRMIRAYQKWLGENAEEWNS
jgi:transcriptional regulator with XRE-family HTH domain